MVTVIISRLVASLGMILLNFVLSRFFALDILGEVASVIGYGILVSAFTKLGLDVFASRILAEMKSDKNKFLGYFLVSFLIFLTVNFLVFSPFVLIELFFSFDLVSLELLSVVFFVTIALGCGYLLASVSRSMGFNAVSQLLEVGGFAICVVFTALISYSLGAGSISSAGMLYESSGAFLIFCCIVCFFLFSKEISVDFLFLLFRDVRTKLKRSLGLSLANIMQVLCQWSFLPIISFLYGQLSAAHYSISQRISMGLFLVLGTVGNVMLPKYAKMAVKGHFRLMSNIEGKVRIKIFFFVLLSAFVLLVFSDYILAVFGDASKEAKDFLFVLVLSQVINSYFGGAGYLLIACGLERNYLLASFFSVVVMYLFFWFFHGVLGVVSVVFAQGLGVAIFAIVSHLYARNYLATFELCEER